MKIRQLLLALTFATTGTLAVTGLGLGLVIGQTTAAKADGNRSGYTYATKETQGLQDDEMSNPGYLWVDTGEGLWSKAEGDAGKSCNDCHGDAAESMKKAGVSYPKFKDDIGKLQNIEQRINQCRTDNMKAKAWKWESNELLAMTTYVRNQSKGLPVSVAVDGPAAPFFEKGKAFFNQRRGLLDMACKHCHEDNAGNKIRANVLSEGQVNGFPVYRLKWGKVGSSHRRFRGCNKQVRAKPFKNGSDEYVNLELYVAWRGRGLGVETPAVRN
jgi:L-cysteine S-thiosulfotransferase